VSTMTPPKAQHPQPLRLKEPLAQANLESVSKADHRRGTRKTVVIPAKAGIQLNKSTGFRGKPGMTNQVSRNLSGTRDRWGAAYECCAFSFLEPGYDDS
jgi:hypothetical protein